MRFRRRGKLDANQVEIVRVLEAVGCRVLDLTALGGGCPDLLVSHRGKMWLMEVKNPGGRNRIEPAQRLWSQRWKGPRPVIARSAREALSAIGFSERAAWYAGCSV